MKNSPLLFLLLFLTYRISCQRIFFEKYNNELRKTEESNPHTPFHWLTQVSHWYHEIVNNLVYYYYEFLNYFGIVEEIPEQVILHFASTQAPVTYLTKPPTTTNSPPPAVTIGMDSVLASMSPNGQVNFQNGEANVILNNEVLNNLPDEMRTKLLNNKNLTRQLMHMDQNNNNNGGNSQFLYDEKDYTEPPGRGY